MNVTSDNGGLADRPAEKEGYQSKGGLEGNKNSPLEKGHHVLIFIVWPSRITPGNTEELASNQDILATLAAMVCTGIPNDQAIDPITYSRCIQETEHSAKENSFFTKPVRSKGYGSKNTLQTNHVMQSDKECTCLTPTKLFNLSQTLTKA